MQNNIINTSHFSKDIVDLFKILVQHGVEYLIIGGEAVIYYGYPRLTGDIDLFYARNLSNAHKLFSALGDFWAGNIPGLENPNELIEEGLILQFGRPPNRIDFINQISGVEFGEAWDTKSTVTLPVPASESLSIHYIGLNALIKNKIASGRPKDMDDLSYLRKITQ